MFHPSLFVLKLILHDVEAILLDDHPTSQLQCNVHVTTIPNNIIHELTDFGVSVFLYMHGKKRLASNHDDEKMQRSCYWIMRNIIYKQIQLLFEK